MRAATWGNGARSKWVSAEWRRGRDDAMRRQNIAPRIKPGSTGESRREEEGRDVRNRDKALPLAAARGGIVVVAVGVALELGLGASGGRGARGRPQLVVGAAVHVAR